MSRRHHIRRGRVLAVCLATVLSVTGCGATDALLGLQPPPNQSGSGVSMAPVSLDQARSILSRVFTAAGQSESATGAAARAAQQTAYTGEGLRAVRARVRLARTRTTSEPSPLLAQQQPTVLALSRGLGFPRFILAQSVRTKGGLPVLHLLTSPDAATPYRISESAEMMPLAVVKPFGSLSDGSPLAGAGTGLAVSPATLLDLYARQMDFPRKAAANLPWAEDSFSNQVRARAAAVAHDVATQARFAQAHRVVKGSVYAVRQPGGSALVFGVIERTDSFAVRPGQAVNTGANQEFVALTRKKAVLNLASITTLEMLAFTVPASKGQATLVGAREQVAAASGS